MTASLGACSRAVLALLALAWSAAAAAQAPANPAAQAEGAAPAAEAETFAALQKRIDALQAELEAQRAIIDATARTEPVEKEAPLRLYGFIDSGAQKLFVRSDSLVAAILPTASTFVLGNVNLYLDARPVDGWSALVEVRFTNLPNGTQSPEQLGASLGGQPVAKSNTRVFDLTSASGGWSLVKWGGIVLERAYVEWKQGDLFSLRVGSFLTPFGIWNVDHGTPTTISLMLPQFEATEMFATHQTGVEALGGVKRDPWDLGYFLYLSNGRTPGEVSLTEEKTLGGRVFARNRRLRFTLGLSGYTGRVIQTEERLALGTLGTIGIVSNETTAYRESVLGADVSLDAGPLRVRSELAFRMVRYDPGKHETFAGIDGLYEANRNEWDWYGLAAWQLPWAGLEPFLWCEVYRVPTPAFDGVLSLSAGLNIHFNPSVQLKLQYQYGLLFEDLATLRGGAASRGNPQFITTRLVVAF